MSNPPLLTIGQRFADAVAAIVGSWKFIIIQSLVLGIWLILNSTVLQWDIYPYILCNLALSFQAAYATPFILMSQGRQSAVDRTTLEADLEANIQELAKLDAIEIRLGEHIEREITEMSVNLVKLIREIHQQKGQITDLANDLTPDQKSN